MRWFALLGLAGIGALIWLGASRFGLAPRARTGTAGLAGLEREVRDSPREPALRRALAERCLAAGSVFAALEQLEVARALGDRDPALASQLAERYRALGELEAAAETLAEAATAPVAPESLRVALCQRRQEMGDFAGAVEALRPFTVEQRSLAPELRRRLARQHLLAGDWEGAGRWLAPEVEARGDPEWLALRGFHDMLLGRHAAATAALTEAVALAPADAWNRYLLGWAYREAGDADRALAAWRNAGAAPDAPVALQAGAARLLARKGDWRAAATALSPLEADAGDGGPAATDPDYWEVLGVLERNAGRRVEAALAEGRAAYHSGELARAERIYRSALAGAREAGAKALYAALLSGAERRFDSAAGLRDATEAAARWPREPFFLRRRAELLLEANRYREAAVAARRAAAATTEDAAAVADLEARISLEAGRKADLESAARRNLALQPSDPNPSLLLAEWQLQQERGAEARERALALLRQAVAADPNHAEARASLGSLLAELKRYEEAVPVLRRALELDPRVLEGVPHVQLAMIYRRQGRELEAAFHERRYRYLRRLKDGWASLLPALRRESGPAPLAELGELALARRDAWLALCAFRGAARAAPRDPAIWRGLAAASRRLGRFEPALRAMRRAHQLTPPSPFATARPA